MVPKRAEEMLDGGSIYWVIRGEILCRERILDIRPFIDKDGIGRCRLVLDPKCVPVRPRPYRAFQGWRYLDAKDAPPDLDRVARGTVEHAGAAAARIARTRVCSKPPMLSISRVVPSFAATSSRIGPSLRDRDRRQRLGMARFEIVDRKAGALDLRSAVVERRGDRLAGLDARGAVLQHAIERRRDRALVRPRDRRCATTSRGRPSRARSAAPTIFTGRSRSRAIAVTTLSC